MPGVVGEVLGHRLGGVQADLAQAKTEKLRAEATLQTAQHLRAQGLAQRDISTLLGLSHQAVSQLLAS